MTLELDRGLTLELDGGVLLELDRGLTLELDGGVTLEEDSALEHDSGSALLELAVLLELAPLLDEGITNLHSVTATFESRAKQTFVSDSVILKRPASTTELSQASTGESFVTF